MKTIIAGSRGITDYNQVLRAIAGADWEITEVVSGCARGVDYLGERWAQENDIPIERFPARWKEHGNSAGPIRNAEMARYADALIALWDGESRGTRGMILIAHRRKLRIHVVIVEISPFTIEI